MSRIVFLRYGIAFGGYIFLMSLAYAAVVVNELIKVVAALFGFFAHRHFTYSIKERKNIGKYAVKYFGLAPFYTPMSSPLSI
jgi:hypothetical protein